jgi:hypothetical protein
MLMIVVIFGLSITVSERMCKLLPRGILYSLLAWLCTVVAALAGAVRAVLAVSFFRPEVITPNELVMSAMTNFTLAFLVSPFLVWFLRRRERAQVGAPEA